MTITKIDVDNELNRAVVFFDSLAGESGDEAIIEALEQHRRRMQSSINRQIRAKKTPILDFRPDEVIRAAERIDDILRSRLAFPGHAHAARAAATARRLAPPRSHRRTSSWKLRPVGWLDGVRRRSTASPSSTSRLG